MSNYSNFRIAIPVLIMGGLAMGVMAVPVNAVDERPPELRADEPPPLPARVKSGEVLEPAAPEPQRRRAKTGTEYRSSGEVVGVEVSPANSTSRYLLMDSDGNGELETQRNALEPDISTNSKRLFSWD